MNASLSLRAERSNLVFLLDSGIQIFEKAGIENSRRTAEILLSHRLNCRPVDLYTTDPIVSKEQEIEFFWDVAARCGGMPLPYILGTAAFYGREFQVGPGVLCPRPETEQLVQKTLKILSENNSFRTVADAGTGSGAIAVTLALEVPQLRVLASEKSPVALSFAQRNARNLSAQVSFFEGDLAEPFENESIDLLIANLPYLDPSDILNGPRELAWEPWLALDGGKDGLDLFTGFLDQARRAVRSGGIVVLEIGAGQAAQVSALAAQKSFIDIQITADLAGMDRIISMRRG